jgi:NAD(P) transhydrogenase subunit alpha
MAQVQFGHTEGPALHAGQESIQAGGHRPTFLDQEIRLKHCRDAVHGASFRIVWTGIPWLHLFDSRHQRVTRARVDLVNRAQTPYDASYLADWRGKHMLDGFLALYIFMLAAFTGYEIIARVPVILHTPLMSGSNFIHGIVLVGAMIALGHARTPFEMCIGFVGVLLGAGNAAGGYVVTERMLEMFKTSKPGKDSGGAK